MQFLRRYKFLVERKSSSCEAIDVYELIGEAIRPLMNYFKIGIEDLLLFMMIWIYRLERFVRQKARRQRT